MDSVKKYHEMLEDKEHWENVEKEKKSKQTFKSMFLNFLNKYFKI